jgi:excisionase family DNA binding protein
LSPGALNITFPPEFVEAVAECVAVQLGRQEARPQVADWPEYMSVKTAARYLDLTEDAVRKLYERDEVPVYQEAPGCRVRFRRSDIDAYMARLRSSASRLQ